VFTRQDEYPGESPFEAFPNSGLDRSLLEARRLLDQAIATYRDEVSAAPLARLSAEPAVILRYRKSLVDQASDSVLCMFPAEAWHSDVLQAAIARAVRRGVKGAMLFSGPPPQAGHGALAETRSIERELPDLMVVDESIAIMGVASCSIEVSDAACIEVLAAIRGDGRDPACDGVRRRAPARAVAGGVSNMPQPVGPIRLLERVVAPFLRTVVSLFRYLQVAAIELVMVEDEYAAG
jgi:hypothetical protein